MNYLRRWLASAFDGIEYRYLTLYETVKSLLYKSHQWSMASPGIGTTMHFLDTLLYCMLDKNRTGNEKLIAICGLVARYANQWQDVRLSIRYPRVGFVHGAVQSAGYCREELRKLFSEVRKIINLELEIGVDALVELEFLALANLLNPIIIDQEMLNTDLVI